MIKQKEKWYCKYLYNVSGSVIHAEHSGPSAVTVTFGSEFFPITGSAKELVIVLSRVRTIQHLLAVGCFFFFRGKKVRYLHYKQEKIVMGW